MLAFIHRSPTWQEVERFRLILSAFQDGSGMLASSGGTTLPGWRDFERSFALAFNGVAAENKDVFDVRLPDTERPGIHYGVPCKMRGELNRLARDGRVYIELSNSAGKFWNHLNSLGFTQANYKQHPVEVGVALIGLIQSWHFDASLAKGGDVDTDNSYYVTLSWNKQGWYQLHQFSMILPNPQELRWVFPTNSRRNLASLGNLGGYDEVGRVFEWYGESGGQLKYYPLAAQAIWQSERFRLEPLPTGRDLGILAKVIEYFPEQWARTQDQN